MFRYICQRLVYMILSLWLIATATFFLMKLLPGTPFTNQDKLSPEQQEIMLEKYGLNDPIPVQYVNYLQNLVQGDLGISIKFNNRPVVDMITERIGPSAQLGAQALVVGTLFGIFLGVFAAMKRNTKWDYGATVISVLGVSVPSFVIGALLSYWIGVRLNWLPPAFWDGFQYTILPTIALSFGVMAQVARFTRSECIEVLTSDYIVTARAKGLSNFQIVKRHMLRNALIPVITILGPMAVNLMTGTLVIERIFSIPGLGDQFVSSIMTNDYSVIMGVTLFYSFLLIVILFIVDMLYGIIDPRIRLTGGKK